MKLTMQETQKLMEKNGGNLNLDRRKNLTALPENLTVGGGFIIELLHGTDQSAC